MKRLLSAIRAFIVAFNRHEIICAYPGSCGNRLNGRCDLMEPCEKYYIKRRVKK